MGPKSFYSSILPNISNPTVKAINYLLKANKLYIHEKLVTYGYLIQQEVLSDGHIDYIATYSITSDRQISYSSNINNFWFNDKFLREYSEPELVLIVKGMQLKKSFEL